MEPLIPSSTLPLDGGYLQQQGHSSLQNRDAINAALARLTPDQQQSMPNIESIANNPPYIRTQTEGLVKPHDPNIYLANDTAVYKKASGGDTQATIKLASDLMHERYHVEHGVSEAPAYDQQLAILKALGAKQSTIDAVQSSKDTVTGKR